MQTTDLKVLLIEDNPGDAFLIKFYLEEFTAVRYDLYHVEKVGDAHELLDKEHFDIILLDLNLPDSFGTETLKNLLKKYPGNLVIVMTGLTDESIGIETLKLGAQDFLVKGRFDGKVLNSSLRYAFERFQLGKALQNFTSELDDSKSRLDEVQVVAGIGYFEYRLKDGEIYLSDKFTEALKLPLPDIQPTLQAFIELVNESDDLKNLLEKFGKEQNPDTNQFTLKHSSEPVKIYLKSPASNHSTEEILIGAIQLGQ